MSRASEAGLLGEGSNVHQLKTEENVSLISKNITQLDIKLAPTVDGVSTIC